MAQPEPSSAPGPPGPPTPPAPRRPLEPRTGNGWRGPLTAIAATFAGLWLVVITVLAAVAGWLANEIALESSGRPGPAGGELTVALIGVAVAGLPAVLLALIPRAAPARAAGRVWAVAALFSGVLAAARAVLVPAQHELYLLLLALVATAGAMVLRWGGTRRPGRTPRPDGAPHPEPAPLPGTAPRRRTGPVSLLGLAAGLASLLPWLSLGALGGVLETLLAVAAGLAVGALAAALLDGAFWAAYGRASPWWRLVLAGLVAGAALTPLAAGTGRSGVALAELLVLPPLGFASAALARLAPAGRATRWLVGAAAAGPLAFADPDEITLLLGLRDTPFWTLVAAGGSLAIGLGVSAGYALSLRRRAPARWLAAPLATVLALTGLTVHIGVGHPGWYNDRLFVVLEQQADLTGLDRIADRDERLRETYRRLTGTAASSQAPLRRELDGLHLHYTPYYLTDAIEVDAGDWLRPWLESRPGVARVLASPRLRPLPADDPPLDADAYGPAPDSPQWNLKMIGADRVWRELGVTGTGIVVGNPDSGVDGAHPALAANFRGGDDSWFDPWRSSRTPVDHDGHGTHTTATAVGGRNVGVAPGAQWVGCVDLDRDLGNPAHYLDCLQFMLAPFRYGGDPWRDGHPERAPHILTNSWGCPEFEGCDLRTLRQATAALTAAGVFLVVAAGNSGPGCATVTDPPAPYPDVLTVGAVERGGMVAFFSSRGPAPDGAAKPDLVAPGAAVLSALPGGEYGELDGTSMATPHVAGVVALMWSANPRLIGDIAGTREILRGTATPAEPSYRSRNPQDACGGDQNITGAGIVNAYAAVQAARARG